MSAETKAAMDDAIRAHFADQCDAVLTEYVLQCAGVLEDPTREVSRYLRSTLPMQAFHHTLGLIQFLAESASDDLIYEDDEDGEG